MNADNNEKQKESALNSIRQKYKDRGGRRKKNSGVEIKTTTTREIISQSEEEQPKQKQLIVKEEKIIINEGSFNESYSKITKTKTMIEDEDARKSNRQQIVITKNSINQSNEAKHNSRASSRQKEERIESGRQGNSAKKGEIITIKTITTNLSKLKENERQSSRANISRNKSQEKIVEIKKEIINGQRQSSRDSRSSRKEVTEQIDKHQRNNSSIDSSRGSRKNIIKQVDTYQTNTSGDGRGSRKNVIKQVDTYSRDSRDSRKDISKQIDTYQGQNFRNKSKNQEGSELNTSQRANSRNGSQNSKGHVIKESASTTSINRRSTGNPSNVNSNEKITKINQSYSFYQDPKYKTMTNMGFHASNSNKINIKDIDSNKRSSRNSSSNKKENEKTQNTIKVHKVLVTNKATNQRKIYNIKTTPIIKSNKNNYNTSNNYKIDNKYDTNTNKINNSIASKLAINELKPKEKNPFSTMTNFFRKDNLSFHIINESGKKPKKPYVLHVRKLDRISSNSRLRRSYYNEKDPFSHNINYKSVIVKKATNEDNNLINKKNAGNRLNNILVVSSSTKSLNESVKLAKKPINVNPRKNEINKQESIQTNSRMRMSYNNDTKSKDPYSNDIHHKIVSVKNVSEEENLINEENMANRMNYIKNIFKINTGRKELNESENATKMKVYDTHQQNDIKLKSDRVQSNSKMRMSYNSDIKNTNSTVNDIHHKIVSIKNVSEEENLINEENLANRMNYLNTIFKINSGNKELIESGQLTKSQIYDTHRNNGIIKSNINQSNSKIRMSYNNDIKNKNPFSNDIHHKILSIRNVSEEENLINDKNMANRMNYIQNIFKINTGKKEMNESSYSKNDLIKSVQQRSKINYSNYSENQSYTSTSYIKQISNQSPIKNVEVKTNLNNKIINVKKTNYINKNNDINKINQITKINNTNGENFSRHIISNNISKTRELEGGDKGNRNYSRDSNKSRNSRNNSSQRVVETNDEEGDNHISSSIKRSTYNNSGSKVYQITSSDRRSRRNIVSSGNLGTGSQNMEIKKTQIIQYGSRNGSRGNSRSNSIGNYENKNESTFSTTKPIRRTTSEVEFDNKGRGEQVVKIVRRIKN